jgi:hypothetical protein
MAKRKQVTEPLNTSKTVKRVGTRRPGAERMRFAIEEQAGDVHAVLVVGDSLLLNFKNQRAPAARTTYGTAQMEELLETARHWTARESRYGSPSGWLDFYVRGQQRDVAKEILEIRKSLKRIERAMRGVQVAHLARKHV